MSYEFCVNYLKYQIGEPHTVPVKVTGTCGSILVRLIPAPRGTGIVAAGVPKKLLTMAGVEDCYTAATGKTHTLGNFGAYISTIVGSFHGIVLCIVIFNWLLLAAMATFIALQRTYLYLTPDLWANKALPVNPYAEHSDFLEKTSKRRY